MNSQKTSQIIESIKSMTDSEADILEIFIIGFRAGRNSKNESAEQLPENRPA